MVVLLFFSFVCYTGETEAGGRCNKARCQKAGRGSNPFLGLDEPRSTHSPTPASPPRLPAAWALRARSRAFHPVHYAAARSRPSGRAQRLCGLRVSRSSRRPYGWHGNRATCSRAARPFRTRRCHRRSRGRRRSHDAPRQSSPQWAAMLSE